ncbi:MULTISPECIES: DUF4012 domain-containing protein [Microbacterium]|uniref:DUF4012 domain-containing protein n=1 Tax=Microbacterium TaxID=33882 RepID=UPI00217EC59F|nr:MULTISPECIES: DUF4012 domain-containing protein [Microbacterium]UWF77875.1 DUF4012 domain-containing protein [Microbacterium neungamense]WCM56051.1 DUF4012 domain-containing protein [Microbacterium sp. EF45047]
MGVRSASRRGDDDGRADGVDDVEQLFAADSGDESPPRRKRRHPVRAAILWTLLVLILLAIAAAIAGAVFVNQAMQVRDDLQAAKSKMSQLVPLVRAGDTAKIDQVSAEVLELTASADRTASNDLWTFASRVPWVGANVTAVSETTQATHILVRDAMPIMLDLMKVADIGNIKVEGGGINLEPFRAAQPQIPALRAVFDEAKSHVDRIDRDAIHPMIEENIGQIVDVIDDAAPALAFAEKHLPLVLSVLGADGPRTYALLFQNNAEIRATGGNPGAGTILLVDNGRVTMRDDPQARIFVNEGPTGRYRVGLDSPEKMALFEEDTWFYSQNYTRPPDFADAATMVNGLWAQTIGGRPDGIIALDPVVLSYMLSVAGPVTVPGEATPVTADNAVKLLLSDTYERFGNDGPAADAYFAKVSSAVFSTVMSGGWDPLAMLEQLKKAASEQRIYAWFADPAQQAMAVELGIDGHVASTNAEETQVGVYLNDSSYSKLEYYLSNAVTVTCSAENRTVTTALTMQNSVPTGDLSTYTLGHRNPSWGFPRTTMLLDVIGMALPGGQLVGVDPASGDRDGWDRSGVYNGRETRSLFIAVPKGESRTVSFTSTVPADAAAPLAVRYTPTVTQTPVTIDPSCDALFPRADAAQ